MIKDSKHLPVIGVGPLIVIPQLLLVIVSVILTQLHVIPVFSVGKTEYLKTVFVVIGVVLIIYGVYMWCYANFRTKIDKCITENKLVTTGVYAIVRNPIYSAFFLVCAGIIFISGNLLLFAELPVCWIYMTIMLKYTEEKWLYDLYGQEYEEYCRKVNRCIPRFYARHKQG